MNGGPSSFRHDQGPYERPTLGWRCGRAALWNTPCKRGPSASGVCGGQSACSPTRSGDAWHCRRSAAEGGPCANGPGPDGSCGTRLPPCVPRRTLSVWRGRLSVLAIGAVLAAVALFAHMTDRVSGAPTSLDPGPLSAAHSHFAGSDLCATCHTAFGKGAGGWWKAFWSPAALMPQEQPDADIAAHRLSAACTECHSFGNKERLAHNQVFEGHAEIAPTDCLMCHTEHKGRLSQITTLTQTQCQTCHTRVIKDFATDHPKFPAKFPYDHTQAITFDHANHYNKYFNDPHMKSQVPPGGCVGCHEVGEGGRALQPTKFEKTCANCHADEIAKKDFILFRWPEIDANDITSDEIGKSCGASAEPPKPDPGKPAPAFSGVSADPLNSMSAFILDVPASEVSDYEKPVQDLARDMMRDGADPLFDAVAARLSNGKTEKLFAGLDSEQVRQAACAWAGNQEYSQPGQKAVPGWRADDLDIRYTHPSHADPVLKAWIEAVAAQPIPDNDDAAARLVRARREMLSYSEGPGQCMKCHAVSGQRGGPLTVSWQVQLGASPALTRFDHRPHLDLLGPEKTCTSCHRLADSILSVENTGLKGIALDTCAECHAAGKVRDDCQTCHVYHQGHAFRKRMMQDAM